MGTVFNLEVSQYWFELEGGGRICLRPLTVEDWKAIEKATVKKKVVFKPFNGKLTGVEWRDVDEDRQNEEFWDRTIVDWENFIDGNGKPIPCNRKTKMMLLMKSARFVKKLTEFLEIVAEKEAERQEAIEKN